MTIDAPGALGGCMVWMPVNRAAIRRIDCRLLMFTILPKPGLRGNTDEIGSVKRSRFSLSPIAWRVPSLMLSWL